MRRTKIRIGARVCSACLAALIATLLIPAFARADTELPTVSLDLSALGADDYRAIDALNLERRTVLRLLEDGFAAVRAPARADVIIRIRVDAGYVVLSAVGPGGAREDRFSLDQTTIAELHLEIAHKVSALARAVGGPRAPEGTVAADVHVTRSQPAVEYGVGVGAGATLRRGGTDPTARIDGSVRPVPWLDMLLQTALTRSQTPAVRVDEWRLLGGVGVSRALSARLGVELGVLGGVVGHQYNTSSAVLTPRSGVAIGPVGALQVSLRVRLHRRLAIELQACPGIAPSFSHTLDAMPLWQRGGLMLDLGAALTWYGD